MVRKVQTGPATGLVASVALLGALAWYAGLGASGWLVGVGCATALTLTLAHGLARHGAARLGPADRVTLARATLVVGVAALAVDSAGRSEVVWTLVALSAVALVLDAVDGRVARRTATVSALGARFDMEVDAFLILVLSAYVAQSTGLWVLAIGVTRYAFVAAGWLLPWLRGTAPPRYWCKVVAATQGVVLVVAAAGVLPHGWAEVGLTVSLLLLAESFGREVAQLWLGHRATAGTAHLVVTQPLPVLRQNAPSMQERRSARSSVTSEVGTPS